MCIIVRGIHLMNTQVKEEEEAEDFHSACPRYDSRIAYALIESIESIESYEFPIKTSSNIEWNN